MVVDREWFKRLAIGNDVNEQRIEWPMYPSEIGVASLFRPLTALTKVVLESLGSVLERMARRRVQMKVVKASLEEMYLISDFCEHSNEASAFSAATFAGLNLNNLQISLESLKVRKLAEFCPGPI